MSSTKIIHKFENGLSGSDVLLVEINGQSGVLKQNVKNVNSIIDKVNKLPFLQPKIYWYTDNSIFMEYIPGVSIKQYLEVADKKSLDKLVSFISEYFQYCITNNCNMIDYTSLIDAKSVLYKNFYDTEICFDKILPSGTTHGDFTFDNIIFHNNNFYMIDVHATDYSSVYFDANKLRQDLTGLWFVRKEKNKIQYKISCEYIYAKLNEQFSFLFNDDIYKLMLLRVLPYCRLQYDREFILKELETLCK